MENFPKFSKITEVICFCMQRSALPGLNMRSWPIYLFFFFSNQIVYCYILYQIRNTSLFSKIIKNFVSTIVTTKCLFIFRTKLGTPLSSHSKYSRMCYSIKKKRVTKPSKSIFRTKNGTLPNYHKKCSV